MSTALHATNTRSRPDVGSLAVITDALDTARSKTMSYDGLDRLTSASAAIFGGNGVNEFTYDPLDNLRSWKLGGVKDFAQYVYGQDNRLAEVRNTAGQLVHSFNYDVQGNLSDRNSVPHEFDYGNRLWRVRGQESYRYDGLGRRALAWRPLSGNTISMYSQAGQLMFQFSDPLTVNTDHVYLNGSLVATREIPHYSPDGLSVYYQHTDALGSPVAVSNQAGAVISNSRTNYTPYGGAINKIIDGVGYTGHVMDPLTGLTYMQQRYYDPAIGRFLSVDPVAALDNGDMRHFNRFAYAYNNPYKFTDPDGRNGVTAFGGVLHESWNALNGRGFDGDMVLGALQDGYDGEGAGVAASAFEDATSVIPGGAFTKIGKLGGVLKNAATGLGASRSEVSAAGKAIVGMLRESKGFSETTKSMRSIANLDVKLGANAAKDALSSAGFKAGTVSGGKQSFTNGAVRFTFSTSSKGVTTIYVAVKNEQVLKIRLK